MADITYREPRPEDLAYIADNLKREDWREVVGLVGPGGVRQELEDSVRRSCWSRVCCIDGEPVVAFGLVPTNPFRKEACIWMLTTAKTMEHKVFIGRTTKNAIRGFLKEWDLLYNFVDEGNDLSLRWLRWLGATVYPAAPVGVYGCRYHYFEWRKKEVD